MTDLPQGVSDYFQSANVALTLARADDPSAEVIDANDRFLQLTGYSRGEIIGHNCRFMQRHLSRQPGVLRLRDFMWDKSSKRIRTNLINFHADGSPFVNLLTLTRLTGPGGDVRFILGSQFDVTSAAPSELIDHDGELSMAMRKRIFGNDQREMLFGSYQSMGEAAASITQARMLLDEADRAGMLT